MSLPAQAALRGLPAAAAATRLAVDVVAEGVRVTEEVSAAAMRAGRVVRNAVVPGAGVWRAGSRVHVALRQGPDAAGAGSGGLESLARRVALGLMCGFLGVARCAFARERRCP